MADRLFLDQALKEEIIEIFLFPLDYLFPPFVYFILVNEKTRGASSDLKILSGFAVGFVLKDLKALPSWQLGNNTSRILFNFSFQQNVNPFSSLNLLRTLFIVTFYLNMARKLFENFKFFRFFSKEFLEKIKLFQKSDQKLCFFLNPLLSGFLQDVEQNLKTLRKTVHF